MPELLCLGGPLDGQRVPVDEALPHLTHQATPILPLPSLRDPEPVGELRVTNYRRWRLNVGNALCDIYVVDGLTDTEVMRRLIDGYCMADVEALLRDQAPEVVFVDRSRFTRALDTFVACCVMARNDRYLLRGVPGADTGAYRDRARHAMLWLIGRLLGGTCVVRDDPER